MYSMKKITASKINKYNHAYRNSVLQFYTLITTEICNKFIACQENIFNYGTS